MLGRLLILSLAGAALCQFAESARADNCRYLEMQLMQMQASPSRQAEAANVRSMLRDRGCTGHRRAPSADNGNFRFDFNGSRQRMRRDLFGRELRQVVREPSRRSRDSARPRRDSGTYRTLCVRSCDGYYFPISFSTTRQHLAEDEVTCQQLCPGGGDLYYHSVRSEGPEQMRSMKGDAYADLENAFRYRDVLDQSCTCGTSAGAPISTPADALTVASVEPAPVPRSRPAPGADPETMLNRLGDLSFDVGGRAEATASVRVVLPPWYTTKSTVLLSAVPN
jgi:hypothetical protein